MYKRNDSVCPSVCFSVCLSETQYIQCYVSLMYFHYDGELALFAPPVRRDYGEGTFPPCISNVQDERCKSTQFHVQRPPLRMR